jgi:hypothetical protein
MSLATLRSVEAGTRPLNSEDQNRIAYWVGAKWDQRSQAWVYTHDRRIRFTRELFELYTAAQFEDPYARDIDTHRAALAAIRLLQALPRDSYRYTLFRFHDRLEEFAAEFAPEIIPTLENLRPELSALRDTKTKRLAFSYIAHPNAEKVPGSEVIGPPPELEDRILNFHELRLSKTKPQKKK